jgi:hypothetical protein
MRFAFALLVLVGGCTGDSISGEYTVHRTMTNYEACPPYEEPIDFALSIKSECATSPVAGAVCKPITRVDGQLQFELDERWGAGPGVPSNYPRYVVARVSYMLHDEGDVLAGTANGHYFYDLETTGDDCYYDWDVTATPN